MKPPLASKIRKRRAFTPWRRSPDENG